MSYTINVPMTEEEYQDYVDKCDKPKYENQRNQAGLSFIGVYVDPYDIKFLEVGHQCKDIADGIVTRIDRNLGTFEVNRGHYVRILAEDYEKAGKALLETAEYIRNKRK